MCVQNYKSLCAAVTICSTVVNIQIHRQHFDQLIWKAQPAQLKNGQISSSVQRGVFLDPWLKFRNFLPIIKISPDFPDFSHDRRVSKKVDGTRVRHGRGTTWLRKSQRRSLAHDVMSCQLLADIAAHSLRQSTTLYVLVKFVAWMSAPRPKSRTCHSCYEVSQFIVHSDISADVVYQITSVMSAPKILTTV